MYIVVGSGPTGIACAQALLEAGAVVTMLDVGRVCEPARGALVARLRSEPPEKWDRTDVASVTAQHVPAAGRDFPLKLVYGSSFPYVPKDEAGLEQHGTACVQSWAEGGLSNVWGAAMLPFLERDMADWPFGPSVLEPHYCAVARLTGLAGARDSLEELFPFHGEPGCPLVMSPQASLILARFEANAGTLGAAGFRFGRSRLAVQASKCRQCQLCLTGCVYDAIYRSSHTLEKLKRNARFSYISGATVVECHDAGDGAVVTYRLDTARERLSLQCRRVFVAAGVLASIKILAYVLDLRAIELKLQFHPYFLVPALTLANHRSIASERLHALAQLFVELNDRTISERTVHLQIYTYSPLFAERLAALGPLRPFARRLLLGRLAAIQGYLHSHDADPIAVRVRLDEVTGEARLTLSGALSGATLAIMQRVRDKLLANAWRTGLVPLPFMLQPGVPGNGNHIGGVFPMRTSPVGLESDLLGRIGRLSRVHVVDTSVLPSLPSTTITYSAMANAHRIGHLAFALDSPKGPFA